MPHFGTLSGLANGNTQVLLKTEMTAGHGGISGRYERWKEAAFQYAWVLATADRDHHGSGQVDHLFRGPNG